MYKYIIMKPDGVVSCETHKQRFEYEEVRRIVGGLVQIVPYFSSLEYEGRKFNRGTAYANEEGWVHGLPHNPHATNAWIKACPAGDPKRMDLAGTVLFVVKDKSDGKGS